jgi:hypothetical protein
MPAGGTYEPIATTTLGSAQQTVTFSSISGSYTDLVLVASRRFSNVGTGAENTFIRFNQSETGNIYSTTYLLNGPGTGRINNANNLYTSSGGNETADRYSVDIYNIFNYAKTTTFKTSLLTHNFGNAMMQKWVGIWRSTDAITRIDVIGSGSATFATGSTFTLYGITAA